MHCWNSLSPGAIFLTVAIAWHVFDFSGIKPSLSESNYCHLFSSWLIFGGDYQYDMLNSTIPSFYLAGNQLVNIPEGRGKVGLQ